MSRYFITTLYWYGTILVRATDPSGAWGSGKLALTLSGGATFSGADGQALAGVVAANVPAGLSAGTACAEAPG